MGTHVNILKRFKKPTCLTIKKIEEALLLIRSGNLTVPPPGIRRNPKKVVVEATMAPPAWIPTALSTPTGIKCAKISMICTSVKSFFEESTPMVLKSPQPSNKEPLYHA